MHLRRLAIALAPIVLLPLAACGGQQSSPPAPPAAPATTSTAASTPASSATTARASASASAGAGDAAVSAQEKSVKLGQKFTDPETGDVIELIEVVRNAAPEKAKSEIAKGGEVVLMKIRVTPGTKFGGTVSRNNFRLLADGDAKAASSSYQDQLGAGREAFDSLPRREGKTAEGWVAWLARAKQDSYTFRYDRPQAKILGQDKQVPAFTKELQV